MKRFQPYLLLSLLCISSIAATITGLIFQRDLYPSESLDYFTESPIGTFMLTMKDSRYMDYFSDTATLASVNVNECFSTMSLPDVEQAANTNWDTIPRKLAKVEENWADIPRKFTKVDENYFKDALFIGDSRTVGIQYYAGFEEGTFYAATSLNIFDIKKKKLPIDNAKKTIEEALSEHQFKKIYIMVGINDVGISTVDTFFKTYKEVIDEICDLQPDALIFLQANLHVTKGKSETDKIINNENIEKRNKKIASLADQKRIFYIDINQSSLCDEDGNLIADYTWDQIHLQAKYYPIWKNYIMQNGIIVPNK